MKGAGAAKAGGTSNLLGGGGNDPMPVFVTNWSGAGIAAGGAAAIPGMISELSEIAADENLTKEEKAIAKGGAVGETVGAIGGAAAGKEIEAKLPDASTLAVAPSAAAAYDIPQSQLPGAITGYTPYAPGQPVTKLDGQVGLGVKVSVQDDRIKAAVAWEKQKIPDWLNPGNAPYARAL